MNISAKKFIEKAKADIQEGGKAAIELFAMCWGTTANIKQNEIVEKTINAEKIINRIMDFDTNFMCGTNFILCFPNHQNADELKYLKKELDAQAIMLENISGSDLRAYTLYRLRILLGYFCKIIFFTRYFYGTMPEKDRIQLFKNVISMLWETVETQKNDWQGYKGYFILIEMMVNFLDGDDKMVIRQFEESNVDLLKFESVPKTLIKLCMFLSEIRRNPDDKKVRFGADAMMVLAQYQYYLWALKHVDVGVHDLSLVMLFTYLYGDIIGLTDEEISNSLQPGQVMQNLERLREQNDGTVYLPQNLVARPIRDFI